ncbi:MAG: sugar ABC transporter permease [Lachnospiraceae bacterium]|nr:sugar ABC transporter permease [Lachnospiraceae bacterium]
MSINSHKYDNPGDPSFLEGLAKGSFVTKLSALLWGFGCIIYGQIYKGVLFILAEIFLARFIAVDGINNLKLLLTLGEREQEKVWDEAKCVYVYVDGDRSLVILLYGIITIALIGLSIILLTKSVKNAYSLERLKKEGKHIPRFKEEMARLFDNNLHKTLLTLPVAGVVLFTILPLIFMMCMAFTDYSIIDNKLVLFNWTGLSNFKSMLSFGGSLGQTFWGVLSWTIVWAIAATFSNYFLGMFLAMLINWKEVMGKKFWRFCFVLTIAVPHFVTLLIVRQMLQPEGAVNILLRNLGWIAPGTSLPFFTNPMWARITVILINIWVGVPYTLLQITGILQNIPASLYEAARIDGAGPVMTFRKITLPYMLFVTTPYLITTFTGNVNNFNVIFLTTGGAPRVLGQTAGKTDLLVTWLYKLTIDNEYYNTGAVIGIVTFITLAIVSLLTFNLSRSNRDEEGFR